MFNFFIQLKSLHHSVERGASGVNMQNVPSGVRIVYAILRKGGVVRCDNLLRYFVLELKSLHQRVKRDPLGISMRYVLSFGIRIADAILRKGGVYFVRDKFRYCVREGRLLWYLLYWILFGGMLLKPWFCRFSLKQTRRLAR